MSTKRARYTGPFPEVRVTWPPGVVPPDQEWLVQHNHFLPADAPAALRDELLSSSNADWSEVEQATTTSKKDGEK